MVSKGGKGGRGRKREKKADTWFQDKADYDPRDGNKWILENAKFEAYYKVNSRCGIYLSAALSAVPLVVTNNLLGPANCAR